MIPVTHWQFWLSVAVLLVFAVARMVREGR